MQPRGRNFLGFEAEVWECSSWSQ